MSAVVGLPADERRRLVRLLGYLRPYKAATAISLLLIFGMAAADLVGPYTTRVAIDRYLLPGDASGLAIVAAVYFLVLLASFVMRFVQSYLLQMTGQRILFDMRREAYAHLQGLHVGYFDRNPVGTLMTRVTSDLDAVNALFTSGVVTICGELFTLSVVVVAMVLINWQLALVTLAVTPALWALVHWFRRGSRTSFREVRRCVARANAFLQEHLVGMTVVQLFRREEHARRVFAQINRQHADANVQQIFYYAVFYPAIRLLVAVAIALILLHGGGSVLAGALSLGALVAFVQYSERFWQPISALSERFDVLQQAMASCERVFALLDTPIEGAPPARPARIAEVKGRVAFEGVWFKYREEGDWILRDIDCAVEPGTRVAIVGATGAGKTTMVSLLARFYDAQKGRVTFDGVDVRELEDAQFRSSVAVVLQDARLFRGTVASNIRMGSAISDERVRAAARAVHADGFIEALPQGYETPVLERGANLSVGQKQLLSFARGLAHDPRLLILDEATSSVDTQTEQLLQAGLKSLLRGRTAIIVAHRLSTLHDVDDIIVLHKGCIRERGTQAALLAQRGMFWRLYQLQFMDPALPFRGIPSFSNGPADRF